ncbi:Protein N-acetyltransferase, RimJ/RimL family [Geosporobacter subterraneus DSM 17957]|uniref:Protein N-acetyltransferase, RimJ/RimL family n=1 Tax=Geosporobacter subterraneus DSM 17957 TaxID=1121919 RepID=A0A1M6QFW5_9FIRM|nr:GNAT family protein [Geosporobacter subterraneus]SHK19142.1 Protein N-acetyltransferase, RimJ/RimL family [Geosporobacter subterraneus DSM 17957]
MIRLQPLEREDLKKILEWNKNQSADDLAQWAGPLYHHPLTEDQLEDYFTHQVYIDYPTIFVYKIILTETNEVIGTIELRETDKENRIGKVCRFLIAQEGMRGMGIGQKVLQEIVKLGFEDFGFEKIALNVFDFNVHAIRCYEKVGFKKEKLYENVRKSAAGDWSSYEMALLKSEWQE